MSYFSKNEKELQLRTAVTELRLIPGPLQEKKLTQSILSLKPLFCQHLGTFQLFGSIYSGLNMSQLTKTLPCTQTKRGFVIKV